MRTIILSALVALVLPASAGVIALEGHYQGKNLFVQNPFSEAGVGFCVFEVTVNDLISTDEINSSAFEVDLANFGLNVGDPVTVRIKHKDGCTPLVLNPEVLKPKSTFDIAKQEVTSNGVYRFTTTNETGELPFIVEQYRWNKWVKVGEVMGVGTPGEHTYEFKIVPHSGENKFRVKQVDLTKNARYSQAVKYTDPAVAPVTFSPDKPKTEVVFSSATLYEVYDQYGNIVKRGFGDRLDVTNLKKDLYYLNYDNTMGTTFIKR